MLDLTRQSDVQPQLVAYLSRTERLLAKVATSLSGRACDAEIVALPDLGLPHNVTRILGGFLTGALYQWETAVPFIPVDSTMNVCGVSVFRLQDGFESAAAFQEAVARAEAQLEGSSFVWNFAEGNHFISWSIAEEGEGGPLADGHYLVLHASPAEYKNQFNGLYPTSGNWYSDDIETFVDEEVGDERLLRVLSGTRAERFVRWAHLLEPLYHERQEFVASLIAPDGAVEPVLSVLHYGMPTSTSVAIGCQWLDPNNPRYVLLTRPGAPFYVIDAADSGRNAVNLGGERRILTPHGLGVRPRNSAAVELRSKSIAVDGSTFLTGQSLRGSGAVEVRPLEPSTLDEVLVNCPGALVGRLQQRDAYYRNRETLGEEVV